MIRELRVFSSNPTPAGADILATIQRLALGPFTRVETAKVYRVEGLSEDDAVRLAGVLVNTEEQYVLGVHVCLGADRVVEVGYKPGVMNPESASLVKVARDLGLDGVIAADSSVEYHFWGSFLSEDHIETVLNRLLVNKTVQQIITKAPETLVVEGVRGKIRAIPIRGLDEDGLMALSKDRLFLNLEEMKSVQNFFENEEQRDPTDVEVEVTAAWWSEHCGHKTFRASIFLPDGEKKRPFIERLMETSARFNRGTISAFVDNSGVAQFYDGWAINGKVETHNSPSAAEPYGGAATGVGGVLRDIDGTGEGAKVIASTDMFCFASPTLPFEDVPLGCLHPDYLLRRVVAGVRDYGNRMGVPTGNGSVHFHPDFRAKPTVIVGAYGILPSARAKKGVPRTGDMVVVIGGRTGRDGIHGATFSSGEMTSKTATVHASAVQIGNAIEEKRMFDAHLALRDEGLVVAVTDCGAAGLCSAVGEIGSDTGVHVRLETVPTKYPGLEPWEIFLSESQERTVVAVRSEDVERVVAICRDWNVEAVVIGTFTDTNRLVVTYYDETACDLPYSFLKDGLPQRHMKAAWVAPKGEEPPHDCFKELDIAEMYQRVLGHENVCSKEPIVRQYDHGVQGTNALSPYGGVHHDGPNDAVVLRPLLDKPYGMVISHGLNPVLNRIDPYWGSIWAGVEALANYVAVGGRVVEGEAWLIDNFIWPFPDEESLGALDLSVDACVTLMETFGVPFISGKDSLSSTYRNEDFVLKIPPVLCVSAFGRIPDVEKTMSADFKQAGSTILLVGRQNFSGMAGSVLYDILGYTGARVPRPDFSDLSHIFNKMHEWIVEGRILAAHDVSEGGIAATLAEMCFGGDVGATIWNPLDGMSLWRFLFNETPGCFLIEASDDTLAREYPTLVRKIGYTTTAQEVVLKANEAWNTAAHTHRVPVSSLKQSWQQPMQEVFGHAS